MTSITASFNMVEEMYYNIRKIESENQSKIAHSSCILYLVSMLLSARVLGQKWTPAQGLENPTLNYIHYIASKAVWGIFL